MSSTAQVDKKQEEAEKLYNFKFDNFTKLLGPDWPVDDIRALAESEIYDGELKDLLENGCSKELAVRILL